MNDKCVYRHRRLDTNKIFYIGIGNNKRPYSKCNRNKHWKRIVNKCGYSVEILYENLSVENAIELEIFLIEIYGRIDNKTGILCNQTDGGDGCVNLSKEKKLSISNKLTGKTHSDETKYKMSNSHKGKKFTKEHRLNLSKLNKGRKHTKEFCDTISNKISKQIINIETEEIYKNIETLSKIININQNTLRCKVIGRTKNNTPYLYLEVYNEIGKEESLKLINLTKRPSKKKVIDTFTKKIYDSIKDAAEDISMNRKTLRDHLHNRVKNKTNLIFYET